MFLLLSFLGNLLRAQVELLRVGKGALIPDSSLYSVPGDVLSVCGLNPGTWEAVLYKSFQGNPNVPPGVKDKEAAILPRW